MNEPESFVHGCVEDCNLTSSHTKDHPDFVPGKIKWICSCEVLPTLDISGTWTEKHEHPLYEMYMYVYNEYFRSNLYGPTQ